MEPKKLKKNISLPAFFSDAQACIGTVYFITEEGDQINMKTTLSQLLFTAKSSSNSESFEGMIHCSEERDYLRLKKYLVQ